MPYVTIRNGPDKGRSFKVADKPVSVGRDKTQTIQILDQGVSRQHAEIFKLGELCIIRDLGSTNGTFVNNERIQEEVIKQSDEITIGNTHLMLTDQEGLPEELESSGVPSEEGEPLGVSTVEIAVDPALVRGGARRAPTPTGVSPGKVLDSRNLQVSFDIGRVLSQSNDLGAGIGESLDLLVQAVEASQGYLLAVDVEGGKITARTESSRRSEPESTRKVSRAIVKHVAQSRRPTLISDAMVDDRFQFSESIVFRRIRSVMCVPLLISRGPGQVLYLHKSDGPGFTVEDLELCSQAALQVSMATETRRFEGVLRRSLDSAVRALMQAIEFYDPDRRGHSTRVADFSQAIAMQMGLPREEVQKLRMAAQLHDVGKLTVHVTESGVIDLTKPADPKLLSDEKHVREGEKIVSMIEGAQDLLPPIKYHHERADGSGFPYKIKNEDTPVAARILIVANAFDNVCDFRAGKPTAAIKNVLKSIAEGAGKEFDDEAVKALLVCHRTDTLHSPAPIFDPE